MTDPAAAFYWFGVVLLFTGLLVAIAAPLEGTEHGRRFIEAMRRWVER